MSGGSRRPDSLSRDDVIVGQGHSLASIPHPTLYSPALASPEAGNCGRASPELCELTTQAYPEPRSFGSHSRMLPGCPDILPCSAFPVTGHLHGETVKQKETNIAPVLHVHHVCLHARAHTQMHISIWACRKECNLGKTSWLEDAQGQPQESPLEALGYPGSKQRRKQEVGGSRYPGRGAWRFRRSAFVAPGCVCVWLGEWEGGMREVLGH